MKIMKDGEWIDTVDYVKQLTPRHMYTVVADLIKVSEDDEFTSDLEALLANIKYTAPECMPWDVLTEIFNDHIKNDEGWREKAIAILQNK